MTIWGQEAGMFQSAVNLNYLIVRIKVQTERQRVALVLGSGHSEPNCSAIRSSPCVDFSFDIKSDWVDPTRGDLNHTLQVGDQLGLSYCLKHVVTLTEAKDALIVASHRVDIAILGQKMWVSLAACNLLDKDVVAAHFGELNERRSPLFFVHLRVGGIRIEEAELAMLGVTHDKHFGVRLLDEALIELFQWWLLLQRLFLSATTIFTTSVLISLGSFIDTTLDLARGQKHLVRLRNRRVRHLSFVLTRLA